MTGIFHRSAEFLRAQLAQKYFGALMVVVMTLALFGVIPSRFFGAFVLLYIGVRAAVLLREGLTPPVDWEARTTRMLALLDGLPPEELAAEAVAYDLSPRSTADQVTTAAVAASRARYVPPRAGPELICECLGVVTYPLLIPIGILLYTRDFVSPGADYDWLGFAVVVAGIGLYVWPRYWKARAMPAIPANIAANDPAAAGSSLRHRRMLWWSVPFLPVLGFVAFGIVEWHPYLNPLNPEHTRLRTEKVLSLTNNVVAAQNAAWLFDYAQELEAVERRSEAAQLYRQVLILQPTDELAAERLAALGGRRVPLLPIEDARFVSAWERAYQPLWLPNQRPMQLPGCTVDTDGLRSLDGATIIIVPVGAVPESLMNATGNVIEREFGLSACIATRSIPLPEPGRLRGLIFGRQWRDESFVEAFQRTFEWNTIHPARFLLITGKDMYVKDTNYVISTSYPWGALLSYARFDEGDELLLTQRTSKQALGALATTLGVPRSSDPLCVTSYTKSVDEFDAKGNRPNRETLGILRREIRELNRQWQATK
jgi:predicted Zn-dependent protease